MSRLNIGLIGASRIAPYALIAPAREIGGVHVSAIAARDSVRAHAFASRHGIDRIFASYAELLADPDIDLVYISTPPSTHCQLTLNAIAAGKNVLVEKPAATCAIEAERMYAAASAASCHVFEAMHSLHHPLFAHVRAILESGRVGALEQLDAGFSTPISVDPSDFRWSADLGGGALSDLGIYPLAWCRFFSGEQFQIKKSFAQFLGGVDCSFYASLLFESGSVATISSAMLGQPHRAWLTIHCSRGRIEVDNPLVPHLGNRVRVITSAGTDELTVPGRPTYHAQLLAIRDACFGHNEFPLPADDYVYSMRALDRVRVSFSQI